jgi:hypothetical protein
LPPSPTFAFGYGGQPSANQQLGPDRVECWHNIGAARPASGFGEARRCFAARLTTWRSAASRARRLPRFRFTLGAARRLQRLGRQSGRSLLAQDHRHRRRDRRQPVVGTGTPLHEEDVLVTERPEVFIVRRRCRVNHLRQPKMASEIVPHIVIIKVNRCGSVGPGSEVPQRWLTSIRANRIFQYATGRRNVARRRAGSNLFGKRPLTVTCGGGNARMSRADMLRRGHSPNTIDTRQSTISNQSAIAIQRISNIETEAP